MKTSFWACALLLVAGCTSPPPAAPASTDRLINKVWRITSPPDRAPGSFYIFLSDGTLVMTSCVETYRLATWRADGVSRLMIAEDPGVQYPAEIRDVRDREAHLRLILKSEQVELTLTQADAPFVCADMPR